MSRKHSDFINRIFGPEVDAGIQYVSLLAWITLGGIVAIYTARLALFIKTLFL